MKIFRVFLLLAFAFVLPLTLAGLSSLPNEQTHNSVRITPTVKTVQNAKTISFVTNPEMPQMLADYESADAFSDVFLSGERIPVRRTFDSQRPRTYLANSDSWRFKQKGFLPPIYKPGNQTVGYPSKSLINLNKSSPLRR